MKPLVFWCRWHEARLLLHGRDQTAVWGHLAFTDGEKPFRFKLAEKQLIIGRGETAQTLWLDEMGVEQKQKNQTQGIP